MIDIEEMIANWKSYPQGKSRTLVRGENIWTRQLPGGLVALDNWPLDHDYAWQDVFQGGRRVARVWNSKFGFQYYDAEDKEDTSVRGKLAEALEASDSTFHFLFPGLGFVHFRGETSPELRERVRRALDGCGAHVINFHDFTTNETVVIKGLRPEDEPQLGEA